MTHYDVLGIDRTAKDAEIKKAYHQMLIAFHPDKYQGDKQFAVKKTQELVEAYRVLRHPSSRKVYDDFLDAQLREMNGRNNNEAEGSVYARRKNGFSGFYKYKTALLVAGLFFAFAAVTLFISILLSL